MNGIPGRFPEGEPSTQSVLAALTRAQEEALARLAADERESQDEERLPPTEGAE